MSIDCSFTGENNWFRYRAGGFVIRDNKILFVKSSEDDYFYMIGGAVTLGETSMKCIEREIFEESGIKSKANRLAVICENFFKGNGGKINGLDCHTIEFYYIMEIEDMTDFRDTADNGEALVWFSIDEIDKINIKPRFIKEKFKEILNSNITLHLIEERDR